MELLEDWKPHGNCRIGDPDALFVDGAYQNDAKRICTGCPVRHECLAHALDKPEERGVWGGMTEYERRRLLEKHPDVSSWREIFMRALEDPESAISQERRMLATSREIAKLAIQAKKPK